jgi:L-ornithine N5-oxygenase
MRIHDLIGIGFGPSNIALAIALDEDRSAGRAIDAFFIEKQKSFTWHGGMLLDHAHMQIAFLKDLVTLRNPRSRFTFISYLHEKNRLQDFINLKTFFPSRREFNDYLSWSASQFDPICAYGEEVFEIRPETEGGDVTLLRVLSRDSTGAVHERLARNLAIGVGGRPSVPDCFAPMKDDHRIFHSHNYLHEITRRPDAGRIAIVGGGQSASEIFMDLHGRSSNFQIDLIMRGRAIKPSDDSPFVNEIFNADFTDYMFTRSKQERAALLDEFWHTNYAAPDLALIEQIFNVFYQQKVAGDARHHFLRNHEVEGVETSHEGVSLILRDLDAGRSFAASYDAVVLATGYGRDFHKTLLAPLSGYLNNFEVDRNYRLESSPAFRPAIFLQGACEATHGLGDTLLSVTAVRVDEIKQALLDAAFEQALGAQDRVRAAASR